MRKLIDNSQGVTSKHLACASTNPSGSPSCNTSTLHTPSPLASLQRSVIGSEST